MEHCPGTSRFIVDAADLQAVERMIIMRFAASGEEAQRAARMRALVQVTLELTRALSTYSRHALVHCQGTAGASDLAADTERLAATLDAFCSEIRTVSAEYAAHAGGRAAELPPSRTSERPSNQSNVGRPRVQQWAGPPPSNGHRILP